MTARRRLTDKLALLPSVATAPAATADEDDFRSRMVTLETKTSGRRNESPLQNET